MTLLRPLLLSTTLLLAIASQSQAQVIIAPDTSNTGQNGSGGLLTPGAVDNNWQFVSYDNSYGFTTAYVAAHPSYGDVAITFGGDGTTSNAVPTSPRSSYAVLNPPSPWATYPGKAQFVSSNQNQALGGMPGTFEYRFTFTSPVSGSVNFSGNASADNGLRIVFNGTTEATFGGQLVMSTDPGWVAGQSTNGGSNANTPAGGSVYGINAAPFSYIAPVNVGTNTIDFYVSNFNDSAYSGDSSGLLVTNFAVTIVPEPREYAMIFLLAGMGLLAGRRVLSKRTLQA